MMTILLLIGVTCACGPKRDRAEIVVAIESYPSSLDPRYPADAYSSKVQSLIYNGLLKFNERMQLVPDLATGYEYESDTKLKFHLRQDVRFHDGKPFGAKDVKYTLESIVKPGSRSPLAGTFLKVKSVKVLDSKTIEIELKEPFAPFLTALTVGIIPEGADEATDRPFQDRPTGTGPFQFAGDSKDQWVRLKAYPDYFGGAPLPVSVEFQTVRDDTTRVLKLLHGEVDLVQNAIPLVMAQWLKTHGDLQLMTAPGINYNYLAFNLKDPILKNLRVREALAMALDRDALIQYQLKGFARPATGLLAPSNAYYEPDVSKVSYDPGVAQGLLDSAGLSDPDGAGPEKRFHLALKTSHRRDRIAMARAIARYWEAIGVGVKVVSNEWGTFYRDIRTGNFQTFTSTWVGVTDPDIYHYVFHSGQIPPTGANRGNFSNATVDELVDAARTESDANLRKKYYSQVQKMIALELPYISLWYEDNVAFLRPEVQGYSLRPDASFMGLIHTTKAKASSPETETIPETQP